MVATTTTSYTPTPSSPRTKPFLKWRTYNKNNIHNIIRCVSEKVFASMMAGWLFGSLHIWIWGNAQAKNRYSQRASTTAYSKAAQKYCSGSRSPTNYVTPNNRLQWFFFLPFISLLFALLITRCVRTVPWKYCIYTIWHFRPNRRNEWKRPHVVISNAPTRIRTSVNFQQKWLYAMANVLKWLFFHPFYIFHSQTISLSAISYMSNADSLSNSRVVREHEEKNCIVYISFNAIFV